jgi:hypothetical protein
MHNLCIDQRNLIMLGIKEPVACLPMQTGEGFSILTAQKKQMHQPLHTLKKNHQSWVLPTIGL